MADTMGIVQKESRHVSDLRQAVNDEERTRMAYDRKLEDEVQNPNPNSNPDCRKLEDEVQGLCEETRRKVNERMMQAEEQVQLWTQKMDEYT